MRHRLCKFSLSAIVLPSIITSQTCPSTQISTDWTQHNLIMQRQLDVTQLLVRGIVTSLDSTFVSPGGEEYIGIYTITPASIPIGANLAVGENQIYVKEWTGLSIDGLLPLGPQRPIAQRGVSHASQW
jgi:hypothetical protein